MIEKGIIRLIAIFALKDSRAWNRSVGVSDETEWVIAFIPFFLLFSVAVALLSQVLEPSTLLKINSAGGLLLLAGWYFICLLVTRRYVASKATKMERELQLLSAIPGKSWNRLRTMTIVVTSAVLLLAFLGAVLVVAKRGVGV